MPPPGPFIDPTQPLPRLTLQQRLMRSGLLPGRLTLDPKVKEEIAQAQAAAGIVIGTAQTFPPVFLDEIERKFRPVRRPGGMGCMEACYGVLAILYTEEVRTKLFKEVIRRAYAKAEAKAKLQPDKLKAEMAAAKAADPNLTDKAARRKVIEGKGWASDHNTSDHLYALMGERGLADPKVKLENASAEQGIRKMTGDLPGLYFFGMAVRDNHTVTLAVERAADGSQRMYWLDQNQPGLSREIAPGQLGAQLQNVGGYGTTTNVYPFRPPAS